jgi:hypothetical protein
MKTKVFFQNMLRHFNSQLITHNSQLLLFVLFLMPFALYSQSPQGFNYQAVVRNAGGQIVKEQAVGLRLTLLQGSETGTAVYSETHQVTTNALGLVSMVVGRGTVESGDFSKIDWEDGPYYLKVEADLTGGSNYESLGVSALMSVPYALQAGTVGSLTRLEVQGDDPDSDSALFVVRRKDGQTVFAVYNEGVRIYVDTAGTAKGPRGGFAIGGFGMVKGAGQEYMRVTPDSVRIYINDASTKDPRGGFAIGGYDMGKGVTREYLRVTDDSTRVYVRQPGKKGPHRGGFAIGGYNFGKGTGVTEYFNVSSSSEVETVDDRAQVLWYPLKDAFLAGTIHIGSPDSVGYNSMALGYKNIAMGNYSQAFGFNSRAMGNFSTAIGAYALADTTGSYAFGMSAVASGYKSYAFGYKCRAEGLKSYAIGSQNRASGETAYAIGHSADAVGNSSIAIGRNTQATGSHSLALGMGDDIPVYDGGIYVRTWPVASGRKSIAIGTFCNSRAYGSVTLGYGLMNDNAKSVFVGSYNDTTALDAVFAVGNGTSHTNRSNALTVLENGNVGIGTTVPGTYKLYVNGSAYSSGGWTSSDKRLKKEIDELDNPLDRLLKVRGVGFQWRSEEFPEKGLQDNLHYGVIAQELQQVFPSMVKEGPDGYLAVAYEQLIPFLIEAVKKQQAEIETLRTDTQRMSDLDRRIEELERLLKAVAAGMKNEE